MMEIDEAVFRIFTDACCQARNRQADDWDGYVSSTWFKLTCVLEECYPEIIARIHGNIEHE